MKKDTTTKTIQSKTLGPHHLYVVIKLPPPVLGIHAPVLYGGPLVLRVLDPDEESTENEMEERKRKAYPVDLYDGSGFTQGLSINAHALQERRSTSLLRSPSQDIRGSISLSALLLVASS